MPTRVQDDLLGVDNRVHRILHLCHRAHAVDARLPSVAIEHGIWSTRVGVHGVGRVMRAHLRLFELVHFRAHLQRAQRG
jgi:hypothetical protein